jgi:hypothetical protein
LSSAPAPRISTGDSVRNFAQEVQYEVLDHDVRINESDKVVLTLVVLDGKILVVDWAVFAMSSSALAVGVRNRLRRARRASRGRTRIRRPLIVMMTLRRR